MKLAIIILFAVSMLSCGIDTHEIPTQEGNSKCAAPAAKAQQHFDAATYTVTYFGMMADFEFEDFYAVYMLKNYDIKVDYPGCEVEPQVECYSLKMEALLKEKHGTDFFTETYAAAREVYDREKNQHGNTMTVGGQIVEKTFYKKNGEPADFKELYLRASVHDYYIKLCESEVTKTELEPYMNQEMSLGISQSISVKVEFTSMPF
jgi:hypothetical protein